MTPPLVSSTTALGAVAALVLGAIPPLSDAERAALDGAADGRDHRDSAFVALVEHAATWTPGAGDAPIRLEPDLEAMLEAPDAWRGALCRVRGRVEQVHRLAPPHDRALECFLEDPGGRLVLAYLVADAGDPGPPRGAAVVVPARYYKRVELVARDGRRRAYPAFVGAHPVVRAAPAPARPPAVVIAAVVAMLAVLLALLVVVRRLPRRASARARIAPGLDDGPPLPDDPAEALAELRRRSETMP